MQDNKDARMSWWREARFGMFIHWGLYSILAGEWQDKKGGEWIMETARIPASEYEPLLSQFNPVKFDADDWVRMAKDAGMKYIVITSKHHEGFALWDSKVTEWDVMSTPYGRDLLQQLADACARGGIRLCFYHSIMDWKHSDYEPRRAWNDTATGTPNMDRYVDWMKAQLKELLTGYGPIGVLWFDGEWENTWTHERGVDLDAYIRSLQPEIIINNRVDKGRSGMAGMTIDDKFKGDFGTPEQEVPATGFPGVDWESCITMNDNWGYARWDQNWKSTRFLIHQLVDIVSKGGNYLLNIGPKADGTFPKESVERLAGIGQWMRRNSESIYGTQASPFKRFGYRVTRKPGRLFVHVPDRPSGPLVLTGLKNAVTSAWVLDDANKELLKYSLEDGYPAIYLPENLAQDSVVVVEIVGDPVVEDVPLRQAETGEIELLALDAEVKGHSARLEQPNNNIGYWTNAADTVSWSVEVRTPGRFTVAVDYACASDSVGSKVAITIGDQTLHLTTESTTAWDHYRTVEIGQVEIKEPGMLTVTVTPVEKPGNAVMNLRRVKLTPIRAS